VRNPAIWQTQIGSRLSIHVRDDSDSLVWASMLGFAIWGDVPTPELLHGSPIVVASGVYLL
jgi:hypothetical protein